MPESNANRPESDRDASPPNPSSPPRPWYRRIGPGLVTACVVIGPGSLVTSSTVGATYGYSMSWVVVVAVACMMVYTTLGAKLGVVTGRSPADVVTECAGRWLAALIGIAIFVIAATFQYGNNLGLDSAVSVYTDVVWIRITVIVAFNVLTLVFLFGFRHLYSALEKLMTAFVGVMLAAFAVNLVFAFTSDPGLSSPVELAAGFVPWSSTIGIEVLGLVGTTFSVAAAYYQAYLVRQKGWKRGNLADGLVDARVAASVMGVITLMIVWTAGTVLHGRQLGGGAEIARQLEPLFGKVGETLFCIGLFCAAYSSFLVNSMIGGFVLSDGLGLGSAPEKPVPKLLTAVALLIGMGVAISVLRSGTKPDAAIVVAQAMTVLISPLMAIVLLWLTNRRDLMGEDRNGPIVNGLAVLGLLLLLVMAYRTADTKVLPAISNWLN